MREEVQTTQRSDRKYGMSHNPILPCFTTDRLWDIFSPFSPSPYLSRCHFFFNYNQGRPERGARGDTNKIANGIAWKVRYGFRDGKPLSNNPPSSPFPQLGSFVLVSVPCRASRSEVGFKGWLARGHFSCGFRGLWVNPLFCFCERGGKRGARGGANNETVR